MNRGRLLAELAASVGPRHLLTGDDASRFGVDWTGRWQAQPLAVVRPADTAEVAGIVRVCARAGVPLVPQGGRTGLVGGSVPGSGGTAVVLTTARLSGVGAVQHHGREASLVAGAGATLQAVQDAARAAGLAYGVDMASRGTATVGGTVATDAGGVRVVVHGSTRDQVRGLEAVLGTGGALSRLDPPLKDSTGFDVDRLLVGSEGTLGVVTAVRLALVPALAPGVVVLAGCASVADAQDLLAVGGVLAAEIVAAEALAGPAPTRVAWPWYVLLHLDDVSRLDGLDLDAAAGWDPATAARLWALREGLSEAAAQAAQARGAVLVKLDVATSARALPALGQSLAGLCAPHPVRVWGHLAEANLHVNVLASPGSEAVVEDTVLRAVAASGGTIASEHGVGRAKARWLHLARRPDEVAAMRAVKSALDPAGVLNPGVLLPSLVHG